MAATTALGSKSAPAPRSPPSPAPPRRAWPLRTRAHPTLGRLNPPPSTSQAYTPLFSYYRSRYTFSILWALAHGVPSNWNATSLSLLPPRPPKALLRTQLNLHSTGEALGDPHHPWSPPLHCGATIELVADLWDPVINALIEEYILW